MRKLLISILIVLLIILAYFSIANGVKIGGFKALGINGIKEENENLDTKIETASKLSSSNYPQQISELNKNVKNLLTAKEEYTNLTTYSTDSQIAAASELPEYEVEYLWGKIGQHATSEGIKIKMDISVAADSATTADGRKLYDLSFTATGSYIGISLFISDIEEDSYLEFKIEQFKMLADTDNNLKATFVVKNVPVKINTITSGTTNEQSTNNTNTTNNNTTGNTTTNNTTGNTVKTTNTTTNNVVNTTNTTSR